MTTNPPLPITGRPLKSVLQINRALRDGAEVYCELASGSLQRIRKAQRRAGVFQVQLDADQTWAAEPKRVWAAKTKAPETSAASSKAQPTSRGTIQIQRTPVGERGLEELQAHCFQAPAWLEAPQGDLVIMLQVARRRLVLKYWKQERTVHSVSTLADLVALMREQEWTNQLLDADERTPFRSWQVAEPIFVE